jgi:hypothetical protein
MTDQNLIAISKKFANDTTKQFRSCRFASMNIYGARQDWEVWGIFTNKKEALSAATAWAIAFKSKINFNVVENKYRVSVKI